MGFNEREVAVLFWFGVLLAGVIAYGPTRRQLPSLLKLTFWSKVTVLFAVALGYVVSMVLLLQWFGLWTGEQATELFFWVFGPGIAALWNYDKAGDDPHFMRKSFRRAVEFAVILQFVVNLYPFHLGIEIVLVFLLALSGAMIAYAQHRGEEAQAAKKLFEIVLAVVGIAILVNGVAHILGDVEDFATITNARDFVVPILLTVGFVPFVYLFGVFATYESLFVTVSVMVDDPKVERYARRRALRTAGLSIRRLRRLRKVYPRALHHGVTTAAVDQAIVEARDSQASKANP